MVNSEFSEIFKLFQASLNNPNALLNLSAIQSAGFSQYPIPLSARILTKTEELEREFINSIRNTFSIMDVSIMDNHGRKFRYMKAI